MKIPTIILVVLTVINQVKSDYHVTDFAINRNCTEVFSISTPRFVPYEETYKSKNWLGFTKWKTRTNYRIENHVSHQRREVCCNGYTNFGSSMCIPLCSKSCGSNGICSHPEICKCFQGYSVDLSSNECRPVCSNECVNGKCSAPDTCQCDSGFKNLSDDSTHGCEPICSNCDNEEFCVEPHICRCNSGYHRPSIDRLDWSPKVPCEPVCDMPCVNADCVEPNVCKCHDGYEDLDEDVYSCEPKCSRGCRNGICIAPEICHCYENYRPTNTVSNVCEPICDDECINADCIAPNVCSCKDGYVPTDGDLTHVCNPYCNSSCTHGHCSEPNKCSCDAGYIPSDDSQSCEPLCLESCQMGSCTAPDTCTCHVGYSLSEHSNFICEPVCSESCVNGNCTAPDKCTCNDGYEMKNGSRNKCIVICECPNGFCNDDSSDCDTCSEGYDLTFDGNSRTCQAHCEGNCSSRGQCVEPRRCECDENYVADNDTLGNPVCLHACGGDCKHGTCELSNGLCSCSFGWSGQFCEEAVVCVLYLYNDSEIGLRALEWESYEEPGDWLMKEEPWSGPICSDKCLNAVDNATKCLNQSDDSQATNWLTCYMRIESPCNAPTVIMANLYKSRMNILTITVSCGIVLLLLATVILVTTLIYKKKKKNRRDAIVMTRSKQELPETEEDQLIENDNEGISL